LKKSRANLAVYLLLAAITALMFWRVAQHQFINYDDTCYVTDNSHVQAGVTWEGLEWAFCRLQGERTYWHPLTWVSHMVDCALFGLNPVGHHLVNLFFHMLNTVLVFLVFQRMTKAFWRSAALAALFALHPLQVDTVAWVAERKNLLSAGFWLLTMWAYVRYAEVQSLKSKAQCQDSATGDTQHATRTTPHASRYYFLSLVFFALGLMCKPVLVTLPFVLLLLDYWPLQRLQPASLKTTAFALARLGWEKAPMFLLAGVSSLITIAGNRTVGALGDVSRMPLTLRTSNAIVSYVRYIGKTIFPTHLTILYPYPGAWSGWTVTLCCLVLVGISALAVRALRSRPYLFVGWFWFLGVLVPFIGLIQAGEQAMADRFMYIPILGLLMIVVWGLAGLLETWPHKQRWLAGAATLAIGGCFVCSGFQLRYWQDSEKLFRHAIEVTSGNYNAYDGLGSALDASGKHEEALACYAESVRLQPRYPEGQYDFGTVLLRMGRLEEAVRHLSAAVKYNPAFAHAHINLGQALLEQGKLDEAADHFSKAVRLAPDDAEAQYNLGTLLFMQEKVDGAVICFSEALRLKPEYGEAHGNLGVALMRQGKLGEGATHLAAAARLNPDNPGAHDNLGLAILELNHPAEAADQFTEALRLNPDAPAAHYHLALALVRLGKPQEALPHAQKARDLALTAGSPSLAAKAEDLLKQLR
jgi:tetratricopeptide (TPR) repeat protein